MKKLFSMLVICLFVLSGISSAVAFEPTDEVFNNEKVLYDVDNNIWSDRIVKPNKNQDKFMDEFQNEEDIAEINAIILTKKTTSSLNRNTILNFDNNKVAVVLSSNYEALKDGMLIAIDNNNLKYYQVVYKEGSFVQVPLTDEQLHKIFPKADIVKISQFQADTLTVSKKYFERKTLLLVNDTDRSFFKYSYKPARVQVCDVKGLVKSNKYETIKFSHYGDPQGALTIIIKR